MRLKPLALGITLGILWGISILIITWLNLYSGYAKDFLNAIPLALYPGYSLSPIGSIVGALYGFADGLVTGAVFAWLYNKIAKE